MRSILLLITVIFLYPIQSFSKDNQGNGKVVSKAISITDYAEIQADSQPTIIYEQSLNTKPFLRYEIDENLLGYVDIKVKGNRLTITATKNLSTKNFKVYTNSTTLEKIVLNDAAFLQSEKPIKGRSFLFQLSGASSVKMEELSIDKLTLKLSGASIVDLNQLVARTIDLNVSGSSDFKVGGNTKRLNLNVSGASDVKAYDLKVVTITGVVSGTSNVNIQATDSISINASGASSVNYKGTPPYLQILGSGSSSIKQKK